MRRSGFTLLEVVLATSIAVLLMSGFYLAIQMNLDLMQSGRDAVDEGSLVRGLLHQLEADLAPALAPIAPPPSSPSATPDANGAAATPMSTTTASPTAAFSIGVKGEGTLLSVYVTQLSRATIAPESTADDGTTSPVSDIRRITYYLDGERGLVRQEARLVTADNPEDPAASEVESASAILAEEVTNLEFRYFDGTSWVESWDGAALGEDGKTPLGPPRAVEVTVSIRPPGNGDAKSYRHVIAFHAAPGAPAAATTPSTGTTTPSAP